MPGLLPNTHRLNSDTLSIVDNRTARKYVLRIEDNAVRATDFKQITDPEPVDNEDCTTHPGLRLFDPGFQNTACLKSGITFVQGDIGAISYRGVPVLDLYRSGRPYEHIAFLLIFGHLPSTQDAADFAHAIATAELPPQDVLEMIKTLP